jgi:hypothetical protein
VGEGVGNGLGAELGDGVGPSVGLGVGKCVGDGLGDARRARQGTCVRVDVRSRGSVFYSRPRRGPWAEPAVLSTPLHRTRACRRIDACSCVTPPAWRAVG